MTIVTSKVHVQADDLRYIQVRANEAGAAVYLRYIGGLSINAVEQEDGPDGEHLVPGALIEGVQEIEVLGYPTIEVTVWAGGAMHVIHTNPESEVEARLGVVWGDSGSLLPEFEYCGRCGRHIVPEHVAPHVGC